MLTQVHEKNAIWKEFCKAQNKTVSFIRMNSKLKGIRYYSGDQLPCSTLV